MTTTPTAEDVERLRAQLQEARAEAKADRMLAAVSIKTMERMQARAEAAEARVRELEETLQLHGHTGLAKINT